MEASTASRRDWNLGSDGDLDGLYVETRPVTIKKGPSQGKTKVVVDFHVGPEDELVSIFPSTVALNRMREELARRNAADFEPGERMRFSRKGQKEGANGLYWDDDVWFESAAPKPTTAELLGVNQPAVESANVDSFDDDADWGSRFEHEPDFGGEEAA